MEIIVTTETIVRAASLITALGVIGGAIVWCVKFLGRQKAQDKELKELRKENTMICYGILACLKGLKEQGCNGPVSEALNRLEKHLNEAAHGVEDL